AGGGAAVAARQIAIVALLLVVRLHPTVTAHLAPARPRAAVAALDVAVVALLAAVQDPVAAQGRGARPRAGVALGGVAIVALLERVEGPVAAGRGRDMADVDVDVVVPPVGPGRVETGPLAGALDVIAEVRREGRRHEPRGRGGGDAEVRPERLAAVGGAGGVDVDGVHPGPVAVVVPERLDRAVGVDRDPRHHLVVARRIVVDPDRRRPARPPVGRPGHEHVARRQRGAVALDPDHVDVAAG